MNNKCEVPSQVRSIHSNDTDSDVWNKVTKLMDDHEPIQPFATDVPSSQQGEARHRRCSAPYKGPDQVMETLRQALSTELAGTIFENVSGFYQKYFEKTT